jgi:hypothetical protein
METAVSTSTTAIYFLKVLKNDDLANTYNVNNSNNMFGIQIRDSTITQSVIKKRVLSNHTDFVLSLAKRPNDDLAGARKIWDPQLLDFLLLIF